jgi:hypothetical protein
VNKPYIRRRFHLAVLSCRYREVKALLQSLTLFLLTKAVVVRKIKTLKGSYNCWNLLAITEVPCTTNEGYDFPPRRRNCT